MKGKSLAMTLAGVGVVVAGLFLLFSPADDAASSNEEAAKSVEKGARKVRKERKTGKTNRRVKNEKQPVKAARTPSRIIDSFDGLTGRDRELAEALQAAMDSDKHSKIIAAALKALESSNQEVRQDAVDALGWCGKDALAELTALLADPNDDVRDSAINNWECALMEVDDPRTRVSAALMVMGTITAEDALDSISGQFSGAAEEYIDDADDEDVQSERRVEVVQQLVDIMADAKPVCAEKAKEAYTELTGHDWISIDEAERYLKNPDDYEEPEESEEK